VTVVLVDHHLEGQASLLAETFVADGWMEFSPIRWVTFADVGLPVDANDRSVWRFVQTERMLLLTANRNMEGKDSLEQTLRDECTPTSLPIVTVSRRARLAERDYRARCAVRLVELILDLENHQGVPRLFFP
jgi:hypothetical protein